MVQKRKGKGEGGREGRRRRRRRGRGGGGNETRPVPNRRRIGNRTRGDDRGPGTGAAYHFTTKGAFTDRCTYVHQHEAARKKAARALYIMIRHFGITTKRTAAPRPPRHEFYIWKRVHARKQGNLAPPLSLSLPQIRIGARTRSIPPDFRPVTQRRGTCDDSRISAGSSSAVVAIEFHQPVFTRGNL